jgi:hypothetical protein
MKAGTRSGGSLMWLRAASALLLVGCLWAAACSSDETTTAGGSTTSTTGTGQPGGSGAAPQGGSGGSGAVGGFGGQAGAGNVPEDADFYVAPDGSDEAAGDIDHPFATLNRAWEVVAAGNLVYVRGGTFLFDSQQSLTGRSGTADALIRVWAYPGETPVLSKSGEYAENFGLFFSGDYVHFKGLEITGYEQIDPAVSTGFRAEDSNHNIFEQIDSHHNGHGMVLVNNSTDNLILNCDFHHNQDPLSDPPNWYGNADGLEVAYVPAGNTNTIRGCRSWWNTDDGFDLWENDGTVIIESSWAFWNGYFPGTFDPSPGNGNGFKLGVTVEDHGSTLMRTVTNCVAFQNLANGFDQNGSMCASELFNNTAYLNGSNGFSMGYYDSPHVVRNNASHQNASDDVFTVSSVVDHNSWDSAVTLTDADFESVTSTGIDGARLAGGGIPDLTFLRLAAGSDLIDAGVDVGLPYSGGAPDLGAFERP